MKPYNPLILFRGSVQIHLQIQTILPLAGWQDNFKYNQEDISQALKNIANNGITVHGNLPPNPKIWIKLHLLKFSRVIITATLLKCMTLPGI